MYMYMMEPFRPWDFVLLSSRLVSTCEVICRLTVFTFLVAWHQWHFWCRQFSTQFEYCWTTDFDGGGGGGGNHKNSISETKSPLDLTMKFHSLVTCDKMKTTPWISWSPPLTWSTSPHPRPPPPPPNRHGFWEGTIQECWQGYWQHFQDVRYHLYPLIT